LSPQQLAAMALAARRAAGTIQRYYRGYKARKSVRPKKRTQKTAGTNAGLPKYKIGSSSGVFGKKGKKPTPIKGVKWKESDYWEPTGTETCYWGAAIGTSRVSYCTLLCMHYIQEIYRRIGLDIADWNAKVNHPTPADLSAASSGAGGTTPVKNLQLTYVRQLAEGGNQQQLQTIADFSNTQSFYDIAVLMRTSVSTFARDGYYLTGIKAVDADNRAFYYRNRVDEDMVTYTVTTYCKMQNVTPTDDTEGGGSTTDINANPIRGKVYDFSDSRPQLSYTYETQANQISGFTNISRIQNDDEVTRDVETQYLRNGAVATGQLAQAFRLPPNGAAVFKNCTGVKDVSIPAGGFYTIKRTKKETGKLRRVLRELFFPQTFANAANVPRRTYNMASFMVGLRPTIKSADNEAVKLVVNKDTMMKVSVRRAKVPNAPAFVNVT